MREIARAAPVHLSWGRVIGRRRGAVAGSGTAVAVAVVAAILIVVVPVAAAIDRGSGFVGAAAAAPVLAALLIGWGVARHRTPRPLPWLLLAAGCAVQSVAAAALANIGPTTAVGPGRADAVAVLGLPLMVVGLAGITSRRRAGWASDPTSLVVVAVVGLGVVSLAVTLPRLVRHEVPLDAAQWAGALAVGDVVLAAMAARRTIGTRPRNWSAWLLTAGFVVWGNGHAEVGARLADRTFDHRSAVVLLLALGPLLLGAAALHPSMRDLTGRGIAAERADDAVGVARWLVLPPALLVVLTVASIAVDRLWIVGPAMVALVAAVEGTAVRMSRRGDRGAS